MAIKMNDAVPRSLDPRGAGPAKDSGLAGISEVRRHDREFDGIDWSASAPGWGSMFTGLFLPFLALALLIVSIMGLGLHSVARSPPHADGKHHLPII